MRRMLMTLASVALTLFLVGCETFKQPALSGNSQSIRASLADICPTPSSLTPAQAGQVADAIEAVPAANAQGIEILATEWDRLDNGARICQGKAAN